MVYATRNVTYKVGKRNLDNRSIQCALVFVATGGVKGSCCFGCGFSLIFPLLFLILQTPSSITCTIRSTLPLLCAYKEKKSLFTLWSPGFLVIGIITTRRCGVSLYGVILKGHVNPKNVHFLFTQMFSKYIKYTKGTIRLFSKVHFHFVKALPNSKHSPSWMAPSFLWRHGWTLQSLVL